MSSWTVMFLEPARGMRTSHCSKTYQLGPFRSANSACFRDFLRLITRFLGISSPPWRQRPAFAAIPATLPASPHHVLQIFFLCSIRSCGLSRVAVAVRQYDGGAAVGGCVWGSLGVVCLLNAGG